MPSFPDLHAPGGANSLTARNPYVFVVGCPRSGTTLLQRMLDHHPLLAVSNDTHFIPHPIAHVPVGVDPPLTPELVERARTYRRFYRLDLPDSAVDEAAEGARTYAEFVTGLYTAYGQRRAKPLAGEKTPDYCRELPRLHALFPWAGILHILRDGRDVALSTLEWAREDKGPGKIAFWRDQPIGVCALWWRWQVTTGRQAGAAIGPTRYREVVYERLIDSPEETLREIAAFLGLPYAPEMAAYHVGKTRQKPGRSAKKAWLPPTSGLRDWQTQMREEDVELFEALAGDLLVELGYPRATVSPSPRIAALADTCRDQWQEHLARRLRGEAALGLAGARGT